jgi:hypothetical protein
MPSIRRQLTTEVRALRSRCRQLWLARNRPSEIRITLAKYDDAIAALAIPVVGMARRAVRRWRQTTDATASRPCLFGDGYHSPL